MQFDTWVGAQRTRINQQLDACLPSSATEPETLHEAMRYATLSGGKRLRALLVYATGHALEVESSVLEPIACSVELVHAYSLVHDDLPAIDNDDLRRDLPTCHKRYGEGMAILVGDALQALAFSQLADASLAVSAQARLQIWRTLCDAIGAQGMVLGQAIDLQVVGCQISQSVLERMHRHKTGALIGACVRMASLCALADESVHSALGRYAQAVGLLFQIVDDILDVDSSTQTLGKRQGADAELGKPTYPTVLGLDNARAYAAQMHLAALEPLAALPSRYGFLRDLADKILQRDH